MTRQSESGIVKPRRAHRKSRLGCDECKRRHIRCDEGRPGCRNCTIAERSCSYPPVVVVAAAAAAAGGPRTPSYGPPSQPSPDTPVETPDAGPSSQAWLPAPPMPLPRAMPVQQQTQTQTLPSFTESFINLRGPGSPGVNPGTKPSAEPVFTAQHLGLLHHVETEMNDGVIAPGQAPHVISVAIRSAPDCPYLIDQLLALGAVHLAKQQPDPSSASPYLHQATELQTRALAYFGRETDSIRVLADGASKDARNAQHGGPDQSQHSYSHEDDGAADAPACFHSVPRFLFASLLSLHVLADALAYYRADFHAFIDRLAECFHLHRGVQATITPTWDFLLSTELRPLLSTMRDAQDRVEAAGIPGPECEPLRRLLDDSADADANASDLAACRRAVDRLQFSFDIHAAMHDPRTPHAVSSFSVTVRGDFIDVLQRHRPEALVTLAYFGVLVHRSRKYWVFGDAGAWLIRAVSQQLGGVWANAMRWPLKILEDETD